MPMLTTDMPMVLTHMPMDMPTMDTTVTDTTIKSFINLKIFNFWKLLSFSD